MFLSVEAILVIVGVHRVQGGVNVDGTIIGGGSSGDGHENVGRLHNNDIVNGGGGSSGGYTQGGAELNLNTNTNGGSPADGEHIHGSGILSEGGSTDNVHVSAQAD